ncbi:MAG: hypothetical protein JOZ81_07870 [Chloroflexi bacterium]|nr:hypothetical protein [Chloroflexota bacterium]
MPDTQAPTLEKLAIAPTTPHPPAAAGAPPSSLDQVRAAFRFGWALEELVGRLNSWKAPPLSPSAEDDFPPDLTHQRSSAEHVRELASLLKADGKQIVGANNEPSSTAATLARIDELLAASNNPGATAAYLTGQQRIGIAVPQWDADIVDTIIDQNPAVLTAYELGKALSLTQWRIRDATDQRADDASDPLAVAWRDEFARERTTKIRRHLETLAPIMDARTVAAVSASLSFWSRAYEGNQLASKETSQPPPESTNQSSPSTVSGSGIPTTGDERKKLNDGLEAQLAIWYDLLSGRRQIDGFPVTAVVSNLVRNYARTQLEPWKRGLLVLGGIVIAVALVAIGVVVLLAAFNAPASSQPAAGGLAGGVTALVGFLAARGTGLLDRGTTTVQELETRVAQLQTELSSMMPGASNQPRPLTFRGLAGDVLENVVEQIRLEESKIAISQPLVDYIMGRDLADPPQKVMQDFLTRIIGTDQTSNLDRLQNTLQGLYNDYKSQLPVTL